MYAYTTTGQLPFLTQELENTELECPVKDLQISYSHVCQHVDLIKATGDLRTFMSRNSGENLHLSLQQEKSNCMNTKKTLGVWTPNGKVDVDVDKYFEHVSILNPTSFDMFNDSDTIGGSKKRLQKSVEKTLEYAAKSIEICKKYPHLTGKMIPVITGGKDVRRREQCASGLKGMDLEMNQVILENLELVNAEKIFSSVLKILGDQVQGVSKLI